MNAKAMSQWKCPTCSKHFIRKGDLTRHKLLHTGLKPHICDECGKGFSQSGALKTHRNVHSNLKPFKCGIQTCEAAFGDPSSCSRHRKETHYNVGRYRCPAPDCSSSIKRRSAFTAHLRRHGIDPQTIMNPTPLFSRRPSAFSANPINESPSALYSTVLDQQHSPDMFIALSNDLNTVNCDMIDPPPTMSTNCYDCSSSLLMSANPNDTRPSLEWPYYIELQSPSPSPPPLSHSSSPSPSPSYSPEALPNINYLATPPGAGHISPSLPDTISPLLTFSSLPQLGFSTSSGNEAYTNASDCSKWDIGAFLRELEVMENGCH